MSLLIDDLLKLSGIGKKVLHIQKTDMKEIVHSVIQELAASIQHRFTVDLQDTRFVDGDSSLLRQVWVNLISNAVKYSSKKENPQITIRGEQKEDQIFYSICDNGAGFDPRYAGKLFSVFQRLHSAAEFEGTGIGLALVQRIISRHHGIVWAESKPDEGAVFYFSLPASPTDTESTMMQTNEDLNIYKKNS